MTKTHYADVTRGNESNPYDEWGITACGIEYFESPVSDVWEDVDCKNCLKRKPILEHKEEKK